REEEGRGDDYTVRTFRCADAPDRVHEPLPQLAPSGVRADRVRPGLVRVPTGELGRFQRGEGLPGGSRLASCPGSFQEVDGAAASLRSGILWARAWTGSPLPSASPRGSPSWS